jgi:hypothetical protein
MGNTDRRLALAMQVFNDVIVGIVLVPPPASIVLVTPGRFISRIK